jgi:hypothetical protein
MSAPTQLVSALPGDSLALSRSVEVPEGARAALLHARGLFRLDVCPRDDTVRTVVRNLSTGRLDLRSPGYGAEVLVQGELPETAGPGRYDIDFALGEGEDRVGVRVVIATLKDRARGVTRFTGQAIIRS